MFRPVSSRVTFPQQEEDVLRLWKERDIFKRSVEARREGPLFVFYEGPPTANGRPGVHHALMRVFKDVIPRYKAMRGYHVPRRGGWDTHGLPVELEVERSHRFTSKANIEAYGVARFNEECRASVFTYVDEWERFTERLGSWLDMDAAYVTLKNDYIESGWWIVKALWDKGLLYRDYKVTPHCPRCGTSLSSHEVALGYKDDAEDPSVYVKFRTTPQAEGLSPALRQLLGPAARPLYLLAWTTTPWTLPANTALAVAPDADYVLAEVAQDGGVELLLLARARAEAVLGEGYQAWATVKGSDLAGLRYEPLYAPEKLDRPAHRVVNAGFVSMEEGTGIVHIAPAYGEDDLSLARQEDLPLVHTVDLKGEVTAALPQFAGRFVKKADPLITRDLKERGLLFKEGRVRHTYPFCWRCDSPLLYYAKTSWYIRTTARKERLLSANEEINWYPDHIKSGRFGEWLRNNVDWALSRERYWGTPLPIWECAACGHQECVGSRAELRGKPGLVGWRDDLDLHRPFVDEVTYACPRCQGTMRRVPDLVDVWFDSGAMPLAQWHYPFENRERIDSGQWLPADYICEAVDQTRGWFYTLHALSVLLFDKPSYRNVICLGLVLDAKGEKMSKSKGNIVEPAAVIQAHGADALRWYLFTASPPGNSRRFSSELVGEVVRRFFLTLWNTYAFFVTYANLDRWTPGHQAHQEQPQLAELDRWALSELNLLVQQVTAALEAYDPTTAGRRIEEFVDGLSNWYVRRSRRRFWKSEDDADKQAAYLTLHTCLVTLAKLMAPLAPFLAESLYQNLVREVDALSPESVHLCDWPRVEEGLIDHALSAQAGLAMKVVSLGRAARQKAQLRVRQPLAQALILVQSLEEEQALRQLTDQVKEELNVKELVLLKDAAQVASFKVKPNLPLLGPRYGREAGKIAGALALLDAATVVAQVEAGRPVLVGEFTLEPQELLVERTAAPGFALAEEGPYLVAVSTVISPELREEGLARELVHSIQNLRRDAGFEIADRIITFWQGDAAIASVMARHRDYICQETLTQVLREGPPPPAQGPGSGLESTLALDGHQITLGLQRL